MPPRPGLEDARLLLTAAESLIALALARAREITAHGDEIDAHQVLAERVAYAATEGRAARELVAAVTGHATPSAGERPSAATELTAEEAERRQGLWWYLLLCGLLLLAAETLIANNLSRKERFL